MSRLVKSGVLIVAMLAASCLFVTQYSIKEAEDRVSQTRLFHQRKNNTKTILYWAPMFGQADFYLGEGSEIFASCDFSNCFATSDRSYLPVDEFDAIIFHGVEYDPVFSGKPAARTPSQIYIYFVLESPIHTPDHKIYDFFNWTMTYRRDSDIVRPYGLVAKNKTRYQLPSLEQIKQKNKSIAWLVSNCNAPSKRELVCEKLNKHIQVDVYGKCGELECPKSKGDQCYKMIEDNYRFYLAFENSLCEDYVTEKLFNVMQRDIVPIVYGGADYKSFVPSQSVINVMDFASIEALVRHLKRLERHPEEYRKYFEWKRAYAINDGKASALCGLCRKLNEETKPKTYSDISEWWRGEGYNKCPVREISL